MPKKQRITRADFIQLGKTSSKRYAGTYFTLTASHISDDSNIKMACVVSKKVSKSAVVRNRIRRQCREIVRPILPRVSKPISLVFYAKKDAIQASFVGLEMDVRTLLSRV